ncbi:MAG TPA: hypothetical protein VGO96_09295, partial [Pyrinomonadaceae bacterium]|nr:hypothetical protein [Pyrinomonadaceae bacterium]
MMQTEELVQEQPLTFELEYADANQAGVVEHETEETTGGREDHEESRTKKEQILALYEAGTTDIAQIVRQV